MDSQSEGDTQRLSQSLYEQYNHRTKEAHLSQEDVPHTLEKGEPGHIDLLAGFEQPSTNGDQRTVVEDVEDDDIDPLSQPQDVPAVIFPESRRFQPPKTPASQGRKRKREPPSSSQGHSTPRLPVNPFAGQVGSMDGIMGASQLFQATQAVTSPLANAITSDGLSERPSPNMQNIGRPSTAGSFSSPVRLPRSSMTRAVTEPQANYISMKESQEARERLLQARRAEQALLSGGMSDDDFDDDSQLRRRLRQKRYNVEARDQFAKIAAQSDSNAKGPNRGQAGHMADSRGKPTTEIFGSQATEPVIISDDAPAEDGQGTITEDETEREDEMEIENEIDEVDELAEDNKENVEVPGTILRGTASRSQVISSQPTPSHRRVPRAKVMSPAKRTVQVLGSSQISNFRDAPIVNEDGTQPDAIADSQASQNQPHLRLHDVRTDTRAFSEPRSSLDSRVLVPQSQLSQVPKAAQSPFNADRHKTASQEPSSSGSRNDNEDLPQISHHADNFTPTRAMISTVDSIVEPQLLESSTEDVPRSDTTNAPKSRNEQLIDPSSSDRDPRKSTIPDSDVAGNNVSREDPVPDSSTVMPSPRNTLQSSSKPVSSLPATDPSRNSTLFETAPERMSNSRSHLSPRRRVRRSQSTQSSPEKSRRVRSMSEIAAEPSPPDAIGEVSFDIDILSNEDREFQRVVRGSSESGPSGKRRRGGSGLAIQNLECASVLPRPFPGSPLPPPSSAVSKITPVKTASINQTPATSSSPARNSSPAVAKSRRQIEVHGGSISNPLDAVSEEPSVKSNDAPQLGVRITNRDVEAAREVRDATRGNHGGESSTAKNNSGMTTTGGGTINASAVIAQNRVLARFNGSNPAYHPATCLEVVNGEESRYSVRFDDGTIDTISAYGIKRLELMVGDLIKVDLPDYRTKTYVVEGMRDQHRPATPPDPATPSRRGRQHSTNDAAFPETDVHGFATVLVSPKQRASMDGNQEGSFQIAIPLTQIYLTQTLWAYLKNRQYVHTPNPSTTFTGLQTPSDRPSTPATPSSRTRRIRTSVHGLSRSTNIRTHMSEGIFSNMAFAITNISRDDESKRVKDQVLSNGGIILENGFDELLDVPVLSRSNALDRNTSASFGMTPEAQELGFTCLIADKHCRRAKFIQALALGIPCLATRWVSDCIAKQRVLPWAPYLLPSGESSFLSGAIRSRNLQPFSADSASLAEMVGKRPKLLDGASVLLIMEKSQEETMKQHPLLTHALGAKKVGRAMNIDDAVKAIVDAQALNDPWDWVFSYDKEKEVEKRLSGGGTAGRKRKRGNESEAAGVTAKKAKVVDNEFVIQSLILGMLIDE